MTTPAVGPSNQPPGHRELTTGNPISVFVRRIRPTALAIALILAGLAYLVITTEAASSYAEGIVGVIIGALAGGFDKLAKDADE